MQKPILEIKGLHKRFGDHHVLRGIDFSVAAGERIAIIGGGPTGIGVARELIEEYCGGMADGHAFKAYLPGGASGGILPASLADIPLDFGTLAEHDSFVGSHAVIILSDRDNVADAALNLMRFFAHESCGQCTPCREGTGWMMRVMERLVRGEAEIEEIDMLLSVTRQVEGHTICALGDAAAWPIQGLIRHFRDEIEDRIKARKTGRAGAMAAE